MLIGSSSSASSFGHLYIFSFVYFRTNAAHLLYECKEGETIQFVDICSLYPWCCKYCEYPVGHPDSPKVGPFDVENFVRRWEYKGLIRCKVLPPRGLYHPVLPCKGRDKLLFTLCMTCGEENNQQGDCQHDEEERALVGAWTHFELEKALELGYKVRTYFYPFRFVWKMSLISEFFFFLFCL